MYFVFKYIRNMYLVFKQYFVMYQVFNHNKCVGSPPPADTSFLYICRAYTEK